MVVALDKINIFESISWTIICVKVSSVKCILRFGVSKYLIPFFPRLFSDLLQSCIKRLSMTLPRTGKLRENQFNPLTPNDTYSGRTAPLTSKRCILYIYSTNIGTEYFKHGIYSPFFLFKMQFVS